MPSTRQAPERPVSTPTSTSTLVTFGSALIATLALGACSTEALHQDLLIVNDPSSNSEIGLYIIRDDGFDPQMLEPYPLPTYRILVDGKFAAWDASTYIDASPTAGEWSLPLPAGSHVLALIDYRGYAAVTSPSVETMPRDPTRLTVDTAIVFFGNASTMNARVLVNDPAALPSGDAHARVVNALADHQPIQVVQCPASLDGSTPYTAGACQPVGAPIEYGDTFEMDATPDIVARLGFYWAAPGALDAVVEPVRVGARSGEFITRIPVQVRGPSNTCPSCFFLVL